MTNDSEASAKVVAMCGQRVPAQKPLRHAQGDVTRPAEEERIEPVGG